MKLFKSGDRVKVTSSSGEGLRYIGAIGTITEVYAWWDGENNSMVRLSLRVSLLARLGIV